MHHQGQCGERQQWKHLQEHFGESTGCVILFYLGQQASFHLIHCNMYKRSEVIQNERKRKSELVLPQTFRSLFDFYLVKESLK